MASQVEAAELAALAPFSLLSINTLSEICESAQRHAWRTRSTVLLNREFADRIGIVATGRVRLVAVSNGPGNICLGDLREGDVLGLCTNVLNADAGDNLRVCIDRPATILSIPKSMFLRLMRAHGEFNALVVDGLTRNVLDLQSRLFEVAALDVGARLAARLLALAATPEKQQRLPIVVAPAPTHAVLAAEIGSSREAVTRHLADFQKRRLVRSRRHVIEILDPAGLAALYSRAAGGKLFVFKDAA